MARIPLEGGKYFNDERCVAQCSEGTYYNGSNDISLATGSQWDHERLYLTESGAWVIKWWSQWEGRQDRYRVIDDEMAAEWFARNSYDEDELPTEKREVILKIWRDHEI